LLDDDPAVEGALQLLVEGLAAARAALLQQADGGTSARAWPIRTSSWPKMPGVVWNRFNAPMICARRRIGRACTAAKPACRAAVANCGQACWAAVTSRAAMTTKLTVALAPAPGAFLRSTALSVPSVGLSNCLGSRAPMSWVRGPADDGGGLEEPVDTAGAP
jgi:hypothetical protein